MRQEPLNEATRGFLDAGMRVMNAFMLAETEAEHVQQLLSMMDPKHGARILDAGCGIGEVALLMRDARPDLEFVLLNSNEEQLRQCPADMTSLLANYDRIPLPDGSVDVVMFNFAICHSPDWWTTLDEARRVLKPGGMVFIFDGERRSGSNDLAVQHLEAAFHASETVMQTARLAGFELHQSYLPAAHSYRLRDVMSERQAYDQVVGDVVPIVWKFRAMECDDPIALAFRRHERIGFQFSGGRDSTAALYRLRPYWDRMTVYHLDTGDQFPETQAVVARVAQDVNLTIIGSDVRAYHEEVGLPSDLVPVDNTPAGRLVSGRKQALVSRYECCYQNLMRPLHERMRADGITLLVRGQRDDEYDTPPLRSGQREGGTEVLYPIQDWTGDRVSDYLQEYDLPLAPFYERGARRAPECMSCTAWWDEGRAGYMRTYHPVQFERLRERMSAVRKEVNRQFHMLTDMP